VVLKNFSFAKYGLFVLIGAAANAAPQLVLTQTAFTVAAVPGSNGDTQIVDAGNVGNGTLNLTATSSVPWLAPTIGKATTCSLKGPCTPISIALQTASLAAGTYTGVVTISDPNAVNAPQFVSVTVMVGGAVPDNLVFYVPPGGSVSQDFVTATPVTQTVAPPSPWLSIAVDGVGTFKFNVPYKVTATAGSGMATGDSNATITLAGSSFAPDNKAISVVLHVTTLPILVAAPSTVSLTGVQGATKQTASIALSNGGQGTLTPATATAAAATGSWLTATLANGVVTVTADPTSLTPGVYPGTVTIASNAANSSVVVPIQFTVEAQGAPVAFANAAVNNGTFQSGEPLAQGDIAAIFGDQFTLEGVALASGLPLATNLNGTQVLVNNIAAPIYFISNGQIDFEVPFEVSPGPTTIRVVRNGQQGNLIAATIVNSAPRFLLLNGGPYAVLNTPDTPPVVTGIPTHPAKGGDVVIVYAIGLGQTKPTVSTGAGAPGSPNLANVPDVQVCLGTSTPFGNADCFKPDFAGLAPGFVGLYQINVKIPGGLPKGNSTFSFSVGNVPSNVVQIALQ
jgi:uncharacterized protein (TIGR03437 family)